MTMQKFQISIVIVIAFFLLAPDCVRGQEDYYWLSNTPPPQMKGKFRPIGMHKLSGGTIGRGGKIKIAQWIMKGSTPESSQYVRQIDGFDAIVINPVGEKVSAEIVEDTFGSYIKFGVDEEGFYNLYLIKKEVTGEQLVLTVAKAEKLHHMCRNGHGYVKKRLPPQTFPEVVPLELVRKRTKREDFHYFVRSGEDIEIVLHSNEAPAELAIGFITSNGWSKYISGENAVTFKVVQDYFEPIENFDTDKRLPFIVASTGVIVQSGVFNEQQYGKIQFTTTWTDEYRPSVRLYTSKSYGWIFFAASFLVLSIIIMFYRRFGARKRRGL